MSGETLVAALGVLALLCAGVFLVLKPRFFSPRTAPREPYQPVPDVTVNDLERIVRRDFPFVPFEDVMAILNGYTSRWKGSPIRAQLAALKLAHGDLDSLRRHITAASRDYRDVLVAAEYPAYGKVGFRIRELPKRERQRIVDADWKQYEDWLRR